MSLPFSSKEFSDLWHTLILQPKWKSKTTSALKLNLKQLAKYPEGFAIELMNTAIAGNYQGLTYSDTPSRFLKWKSNSGDQNDNVEERSFLTADKAKSMVR